ncbi:MAG TPA: 16S rRNA (uracil(1498)-N(3))-methyltransferase [Candidatus Acidoferrum sp.]|nr:16S rRNA (uracil(1498)-N(3))-methyltransferase [Candidatus Acidoferrum sp.]
MSAAGGRTTRLFVDAPLGAGGEIRLADERVHYLRHVLRLERGAPVDLFNGRDGEWRSSLVAVAKTQATLAVERQLRPQAGGPDLWLVFAPIKRARIDGVVEKATELGVAALLPVVTQHTAVERVKTDRLQAIVVAASEQCERLNVPEVREPVTFGKLLAAWPTERRLLLCAEAGDARPIAEALQSHVKDSAAPWAVVIGPEGGFARSELDALAKLPFVMPVGLGPRILRADTAALAALACWQAILGDGQQRPPHRTSA